MIMARTSIVPSGKDDANVYRTAASTFLINQHSGKAYTILPVTQASVQPTSSLTTNIRPTDSLTTNIQPTGSLTTNIQPTDNLLTTNIQPTDSLTTNIQATDSSTTNIQPTDSLPTNIQPTGSLTTNIQPTDLLTTNIQPTDSLTTNIQPTDSLTTNIQTTDSLTTNIQPTDSLTTNIQTTDSLTTNIQPTDLLTTSIRPTHSLTTNIPPTDLSTANIKVGDGLGGRHLTFTQILPTRYATFPEASGSGGQRSASTKATPWLSLSDDVISTAQLSTTNTRGPDHAIHLPAGSTELNDPKSYPTRQAALGLEVTPPKQFSSAEDAATVGDHFSIESAPPRAGIESTKSSSATYNRKDLSHVTFADAQQREHGTHILQHASGAQLSLTNFDLGIPSLSLQDLDGVTHTISTRRFSGEIGSKNSWPDLSLSSVSLSNSGRHVSSVDLKDDARRLLFDDVLDSDVPSSFTSSPDANSNRLSNNSDPFITSVVTDRRSVTCKYTSSKLDDYTRIESLPPVENTIDASKILPDTVTPTVTHIDERPDSGSETLQTSFRPASVTPIYSSPGRPQAKPAAAPMAEPGNTTEMSTQPGPSSHQPATDVATTNTTQAGLGLTTGHVGQSSAGSSSLSLTAMVTTSPLSTTAITVTTSASTETTVIIVAACAVFALLLIVLVAIVCVRKSKKAKTKVQHEGDELWVDMNHIHAMPLPSLTSTNELTLNLKSGTDTYTASRAFTALDGGQITLSEGDILQIDERQDEWWKGLNLNTGQTGWFPCDFVRPLGGSTENILWDNKLKSPVEKSATSVHPLRAQRQVSSFQIKKNIAPEVSRNHAMTFPELEDNQEVQYVESWVKMAASVSMSSLPTTERSYTNTSDYNAAVKDGKTYRAVYAYKPVFKGELALKEGEIVICKERDRNGWMFGTKPRSKDEGWFPAVYVDEIATDSESCNSDIPETYEILDSNKLHKADRSWIGIEHKVLYDYASCIPGDLSLEENDVITVLQTLANGWWFAFKGDNYGWFPGSYVEMIEGDETEIADSNSVQAVLKDTSGHSRNVLERQTNFDKTKINDQGADSTKLSPMDALNTSYNPPQTVPQNEQKSEYIFRPNRKAPQAPGPAADVPLLKPARPAPAPPIRRHSQLRKESLLSDSYQMNSPDGKVTPLTRQALAFQGKRPKLTKVPRGSISEKQLNPIIRPSTRGFVPRPVQANHYKGTGEFNSKFDEHTPTEDFHQHEIALKEMDRLNNGRSSFSSHGSFSPSHSHFSQVHGSDPDNDYASNFSHERSQTPDFKLERSNSPIIPTSGQFLHNVQRFNRFIRHTSPTLSDSSDCITKFTKASIREHNAQPGNDKLPPQQHRKIPPPVVPHAKLSHLLKKRVNPPAETNSESNDTSETNREKNDTVSAGFVSSASDVITPEDHGVVPITPGKVLEIVQQINQLAPLQQTQLNRTDSDSDTITNID